METSMIIIIILIAYMLSIMFVTEVIGVAIKQISEEWFDYRWGNIFRKLCVLFAPLTVALCLIGFLLGGIAYFIDTFRDF